MKKDLEYELDFVVMNKFEIRKCFWDYIDEEEEWNVFWIKYNFFEIF